MKASALIATAAALCALLTPAGYAAASNRAPHQRPAIRVSRIAPATLKHVPTQPLPANTVPVNTGTARANDPGAVDCTYMVCAETTAGAAGETTAASPLTGAVGVSPVPVAPASRFCADNSYMC
jgi:hypothetical protein